LIVTTQTEAEYLRLYFLPGDNGKMNLSVKDIGGEALVIS
jgi:D-Tyr-tRNAtyr deacylase